MTYEEIVARVKNCYEGCKPGSGVDRLAIQFDVTGEGEGAFYIELKEGKIDVQPYEYYEHDIKVVAPADAVFELVEGRLDIVNANLTGKIHAEGDLSKAEILGRIVRAEAAPKEKKAPVEEAPKEEAPAAVVEAPQAAEEAPAEEEKAPAKRGRKSAVAKEDAKEPAKRGRKAGSKKTQK